MQDQTIPSPLDRFRTTIRPEWIDYNNHMNVAYYVLIFDKGTDELLDFLGIGAAYRARTNYSLFAVEGHIVYAAELKLGDPVRVTSQLIGHDAKRLHYFHRMYHAEKGYLAASTELLSVHVDLATRRVVPFPPDVQARLTTVARAHAALPPPDGLGRAIALKRKSG